MKKEFAFLCICALFLSCSDLSVNEEEALVVALPDDFKWEDYVEINNDVKISQVVSKIKSKYGDFSSSSELRARCVALIESESDLSFTGKVYSNYMGCPKQGWNKFQPCTGKYANNDSYSTAESCSISGCWNGGWDEEIPDCQDPEFAVLNECRTLKNLLEIKSFSEVTSSINTICTLMPLEENTQKAEEYLIEAASTVDSTLIKQHYFLLGRSEGRPYKYCGDEHGEERNRDAHAKKRQAGGGQNARIYYDYSLNLFCFDETSEKIYVIGEVK